MSYMTKAEHLKWAKGRALEYVDSGDINGGLTSLMSDLGKHPETENHSGLRLGMMLLLSGHLNRPGEARRFIEGFN